MRFLDVSFLKVFYGFVNVLFFLIVVLKITNYSNSMEYKKINFISNAKGFGSLVISLIKLLGRKLYLRDEHYIGRWDDNS